MNSENVVLRTAVRAAIGAAFIAPLVVTPAFAVTGVTDVTGTHIKRTDIEGPSPIVVLDRETLEGSGFATVADILKDIPYNGGNSLNEGFTNSFAPGAAGIDLRGLGQNRTLVLLNGRRVAGYGFAQNLTESFVDINSIPISAVERIDILKDGASAIYGADAVAGVVNVILRKNYQGAEIQLGYGDTQDGGAEEGTFSLVAGKTFDKTNATFVFDYFDRGMMYLADRDFSATNDFRPRGGFNFASAFGNPGSAIRLDNGAAVADPACGKVQPPSTFGPTGESGASGLRADGLCGFDYNKFITAIPETTRAGGILNLETEFSPTLTGFLELGYQDNQTYQEAAPTPVTSFPFVPAGHPNNPYGSDIVLLYRLTDAGGRTQDVSSQTGRALAGLKGTVGVHDWEVGLLWTENKTKQEEDNYMSSARIQDALINGTLNPFGGATNSASVINSLYIDTFRDSKSEMYLADAKITGPVGDIELAGGPLNYAVGLEYRKEKASDTPDEFTLNNDVEASGGTASDGQRKVSSAYVEFSMPFHDDVEVQFALRGEDSDQYGSSVDPKVAARWQAMDNLVLRASGGTAYRAPSLVETNLGGSVSFVNASDTERCQVTGADADCGASQYQQNFAGNPDLDPETAKFYNIGTAWQATDQLDFGLDYWYYDHEDLISNDVQALLDNEGLNPAYVVRRPQTAQDIALGIPGQINYINDSFFNLARQKTYGFDLDGKYDAGPWEIGAAASRVLSFKRQANDDAELEELIGTRSGDVGYPKWKAVAWFAAEYGNWFGNIRMNYRDSYEDSTDTPEGEPHTIDSWTTFDAQINYTGFKNLTLTFGGSNITNEDPPWTMDEIEGYEVGVANPRGAFWYGRLKYNLSDLL